MKNNPDKLLESIGFAIVAFVIVFFVALASGTMLWLIYPHIHALFPTAAENGVIAVNLGWWDSVCVAWIFAILIKTQNINKK